MKGIGGNITATIQTRETAANSIGETEKKWADAKTLRGWLDLATGSTRYTTYSAKIQESTHIFIADYTPLPGINAENARMLINGKQYDITLIDNPMELQEGSQLEIYLKYTGW